MFDYRKPPVNPKEQFSEWGWRYIETLTVDAALFAAFAFNRNTMMRWPLFVLTVATCITAFYCFTRAWHAYVWSKKGSENV